MLVCRVVHTQSFLAVQKAKKWSHRDNLKNGREISHRNFGIRIDRGNSTADSVEYIEM